MSAATVTSQQLAFSRVQLQLLQTILTPLQVRAVKQAFIQQLALAVKAYLQEITVLDEATYSQQSLTACLSHIKTQVEEQGVGDFRAREICKLLAEPMESNWLLMIQKLDEAIKKAPQKIAQQSASDESDTVIIAVSEANPEWWDCEASVLNELLEHMHAMIDKHREYSIES